MRIVRTDEQYVESFCDCLDIVARERRYLALTEGPSLEGAQSFVQMILAGAGVQFLALNEQDVVIGWCDIVRNARDGFRHSGQLGMGLIPEARGKGIGRALAEAAIASGWEMGLERIELEVFASNARARALYEALGFVVEGVKRHSRKLDGRYDDNILMALTHGRST